MESNKDEANRCIELAERYIKEKNRDKAEKFLHKAEKLFPTHRAKELLFQINLMAPSSSDNNQPRKRKLSQKADETEKRAPEYTKEQEEAVKRIKSCKDYYEILCVSKDSTDSEIKKAYKKLALQMHPDKNKCPGSSEAFKAIGNAVAVLTDTEKRKQYDLYGSDEERMATRSNNHHTYSRGFESDATAEELFNMFFGTGFNGSNVYVRRGGRWQRQTTGSQQEHHPHHREQQSGFTAFIQILPILLAILLSMASSFFISDPAYSLQPNSKYHILRKTHVMNIPYYVKENFPAEYQGSVSRLEQSVEEEYTSNLRHACYREKNYRDSMIWKAKNFGDVELFQTAQNIKMPSCEQLQKLPPPRRQGQ